MLKKLFRNKRKKTVIQGENRPKSSEFGISRYMERDGKIYMLAPTNKVFVVDNWYWEDPERELHSLRTGELRQQKQIQTLRLEDLQRTMDNGLNDAIVPGYSLHSITRMGEAVILQAENSKLVIGVAEWVGTSAAGFSLCKLLGNEARNGFYHIVAETESVEIKKWIPKDEPVLVFQLLTFRIKEEGRKPFS